MSNEINNEENENKEHIVDVDLGEASKKNFLDYAMYVIVDRALPDIRDGLKPVHRRILWAQHELKNQYNKPYKKSARIVGDVIGKYHPHGDTAVYDALVRMAQPFSMRAPLVDGQGNFGSIDGDSAAAMRYTECRQSVFANSMFDDIGKETVRMVENYDGQELIPEVLPLKYPNLLINGSQGIAVGMASYIPTHNPIEVLECVAYLLDCKIKDVEPQLEHLMQIMPAPDFPTGGLIHDLSQMKSIWETGRGALKLRSKWHEEETIGGNPVIVITEIPYQVVKKDLVEKIASLARSNPSKNIPAEVEGITDVADESDKNVRIVITLKKDMDAEIMFNTLLKKTTLETSINYNATVLVNQSTQEGVLKNAPEIVGISKILNSFVTFKEEIIVNRTVYLDRKAKERAYVLEGLAKALDNLDKTIEIIRKSKNATEATPILMEFLDIEEAQAKYVLEMKLSRLTSSQKEDLLEELNVLEAKRKDYADILTSEIRRINIMLQENDEQMTIFANAEDDQGMLTFGKRKSDFVYEKLNTDLAALTKEEECTILYSADGYIRRMPVSEFECQNRGTRGKRSMELKKGDFIQQSIPSHSHNSLAIISKSGQVYGLKAYEIPDLKKGRFIKNVLDIPKDEEILMILPVDFSNNDLFLAMITKNGIVKRTSVTAYMNSFRKSGLRGIEIKENDELVGAGVCKEGDDMVMINSKNLIIRFTIAENTVRPLGRTSMGVKGMTLESGVKVIGGAVISAEEDNYLACVTVNGMIKITPTTSYRTQNRGGKGVRAFKSSERTGDLFKALIVDDLGSDLVTTTKNGISNRINLEKISITQRNTSGVKLIQIDDKDEIADVFNTEKYNEELSTIDDFMDKESDNNIEVVESDASDIEIIEDDNS